MLYFLFFHRSEIAVACLQDKIIQVSQYFCYKLYLIGIIFKRYNNNCSQIRILFEIISHSAGCKQLDCSIHSCLYTHNWYLNPALNLK